jgi:hypothetical protein
MDMIKLFKINTLEGKTYAFDFDCKKDLKLFRSNLNISMSYTIVYKGKEFIFSNDEDNKSLEELMVLTNPNKIELELVQCHLTLNLGFPRLRQGKLLITAYKREIIENTDHESSINLICPISLQTMQYAIKINGKFYDLDLISEYLANEFNNYKDGSNLRFPMRINLPDNLVSSILKYHYCSSTQSFHKFSKSSLQSCLLLTIDDNQEEYNKLIKSL